MFPSYTHKRLSSVGLCHRDGMCLLRGRQWFDVYCLGGTECGYWHRHILATGTAILWLLAPPYCGYWHRRIPQFFERRWSQPLWFKYAVTWRESEGLCLSPGNRKGCFKQRKLFVKKLGELRLHAFILLGKSSICRFFPFCAFDGKSVQILVPNARFEELSSVEDIGQPYQVHINLLPNTTLLHKIYI